MTPEEKLLNLIGAVNALTPLIAELIGSLRNGTQTDDAVIAHARAKVDETKVITDADKTDNP